MRWVLSVLACVGTVCLAVLPALFPSTSFTTWWPWRVAMVLLAIVVVAATVAFAYIQAGVDRHQGKLLELAASGAVAGRGAPTGAHPSAAATSTSNRRPRLHVEVQVGSASSFGPTEFVLTNHGEDVALKAERETFSIAGAKVSAIAVEQISPGDSKVVAPDVDGAGVLQRHDLGRLMMREWDQAGKITGEHVRRLKLSYRDHEGRAYKTVFDLVYLPINEIRRRAHRGTETEKVFEVRNIQFELGDDLQAHA